MAGSTIEFRRMTEEEFTSFLNATLEDYSRAMARNFKRPLNQERTNTKRRVRGLLSRGIKTRGHLLLSAVDVRAEKVVGNLWVYADRRRKQAFLYDLVVFKRFRGMGYGRAIMKLLDATMKEMKMKTIGLHVFAENSAALRLYHKQGYKVGSFNMIKDLN